MLLGNICLYCRSYNHEFPDQRTHSCLVHKLYCGVVLRDYFRPPSQKINYGLPAANDDLLAQKSNEVFQNIDVSRNVENSDEARLIQQDSQVVQNVIAPIIPPDNQVALVAYFLTVLYIQRVQ